MFAEAATKIVLAASPINSPCFQSPLRPLIGLQTSTIAASFPRSTLAAIDLLATMKLGTEKHPWTLPGLSYISVKSCWHVLMNMCTYGTLFSHLKASALTMRHLCLLIAGILSFIVSVLVLVI